MRIASRPLVASIASLPALLFASLGEAQSTPNLDACGNIYVEAGAECVAVPPKADCEAKCTPINVRAACAAELKIDCEAECSAQLEAGCQVDCQGSCEADCKVDPGEFNCQAYCQADCTGSCSGSCAKGESGAQCRASCEATCSGDCNASCKVRPPTADCKARCEGSCEGSCQAKANIDCQADCQAAGFARCQAEITGDCKLDCKTEEGALFCDGYYVDTGDQLQMCVDALKAAVDITYDGSASGSCENGTCTGKADASASCSALPGQQNGASSYLLLLVGLSLYVARRRRK